jgi:hypothetical protein
VERANPFHDDGPQQAPASRARKPAAAKTETPAVEAGINPEAQAAADLAWQIRTSGGTLDDLQKAHGATRKAMLLGLHCMTPWDRELKGKTTVLKVYSRAREEIESDTDHG